MDQETFSSWLKDKLDETGMTVVDLVMATKLSKPIIYFYLTSKRIPTKVNADKIAVALGSDPASIEHLVRAQMGRPFAPKIP